MMIAVIGENCSGKSTLADRLKDALGAEVLTGKDYLRLAKSQGIAEALLKKKLLSAVTGENLIWVITEKEHLGFLPEGAVRVLVQADLDTVKARFKARMHGTLPPPVERMLEMKHGCFDNEPHDYVYDGAGGDPAELIEALLTR